MVITQSAELGFRIIENVLSSEECDTIINALSTVKIVRSRAGARHLMAVPEVSQLANDPRLLDIARHDLGEEAFPFRATLFDKSPDANWLVVWHQDTALPLKQYYDSAGWGPWSQKAGITYAHAPARALSRVLALRVHLDASMSENGPLRVVPKSHTSEVLSDEEIGRIVKERGYRECLVGKGGVLAMRPLLIHSSSKATNNEQRRVLHIEFGDSRMLETGIELADA